MKNQYAVPGSVIVMMLVGLLTLTGTATATPIGTSYFVSGTNFPIDFSGVGPLTFNAPGDLTPEGGGPLSVVEILAPAPGPNGGELLIFDFTFGFPPAGIDITQGFSVSIEGLNWGTSGMVAELISSIIRVEFGGGITTGLVDATALTTSGFISPPGTPAGLFATFATPGTVSWQNILAFAGGGTPTALSVQYALEVRHIPEPATIAVMLLGLALLLPSARKHIAPFGGRRGT